MVTDIATEIVADLIDSKLSELISTEEVAKYRKMNTNSVPIASSIPIKIKNGKVMPESKKENIPDGRDLVYQEGDKTKGGRGELIIQRSGPYVSNIQRKFGEKLWRIKNENDA